jgi:cyclopropane fatty-acyl-phospholipid synthase-like methyltransferase
MMKEVSKQEIINYYNSCEANYRRWWDLDRSLAMHAGFWDSSTKSLTEALAKENEILADIANISPGEYVLDAGCGYGGSVLWLAKHRQAKAVGITLCANQVKIASEQASKRPFVYAPEFLVMDYMQTTFPSASFDVVWAIESVCHAKNKRDFVKEAWRILKPGGRLILADGFHIKNDYTVKEQKILAKAVSGWAVSSMESQPNFESYLTAQGFKHQKVIDATPKVLPSSKRLFLYSFPALAWSYLGEFLGWSTRSQTNDFKSYHYQYYAVKKRLCKYLVFYAQK